MAAVGGKRKSHRKSNKVRKGRKVHRKTARKGRKSKKH